jgi:hypothetical protein
VKSLIGLAPDVNMMIGLLNAILLKVVELNVVAPISYLTESRKESDSLSEFIWPIKVNK